MKIKEENCVENSGTRIRLFNFYTCDNCDIEFKKQKRLAEGATQEHYCSTKCFNLHKSALYTDLICAHCLKKFKRLKSKLANSKHKIYFCSRLCKDLGQKYIKEIQPDHYGAGQGRNDYRIRALEEYGAFCSTCGYNDNIAAIVVHHIDRNRTNNDLINLEVLCANCHAIEHWACSNGVADFPCKEVD